MLTNPQWLTVIYRVLVSFIDWYVGSACLTLVVMRGSGVRHVDQAKCDSCTKGVGWSCTSGTRRAQTEYWKDNFGVWICQAGSVQCVGRAHAWDCRCITLLQPHFPVCAVDAVTGI